jgi:LysR family transcriptional regulator, regulator for bpeEF and oprC
MKWSLDDLPVFLAVLEHGGVTAAARLLGRPKSTVSVALTRLEQGLGLRLLDRSSRHLRVTPEGEMFQRQARLILEQATEADALMAGFGAAPAGRLVVALPPAFSQEMVAPRLPEFRSRYPQVALEILVSSHSAALLRDRADLAVVVGQLQDSELASRVLLSEALIWVGSPAWLARQAAPQTLAELRAQVQVCESRYALRRLPVQIEGEAAHIDLHTGPTQVNDPLVVRRAVLAGAGISPLPRHYCTEQLGRGELVQVCRHITLDQASSRLTVVYPSRVLMLPRLRVFLDFLADCCR